MSEISTVEVMPQLVLGMKKRGRYQEIAVLLPKLFHFALERKAEIAGYPTFLCHEITVEDVMKADAEGNADIEVAVPIKEEVEGAGDIKCYELPGSKMAKIVHYGPYETCQSTYEKLFRWIESNGKSITGPIRELYLNDPREIPEDEILTEIYAPIEKSQNR